MTFKDIVIWLFFLLIIIFCQHIFSNNALSFNCKIMVMDMSNPNININYNNQNNQKFKIDDIGYKILYLGKMHKKNTH